jgi:hypothetical protein
MRFVGCEHERRGASPRVLLVGVVELQEKRKSEERERERESTTAPVEPSAEEAREAKMRKKLGTRFPAVRSLPCPPSLIYSLAVVIRSGRRGSSCPAGEIRPAAR